MCFCNIDRCAIAKWMRAVNRDECIDNIDERVLETCSSISPYQEIIRSNVVSLSPQTKILHFHKDRDSSEWNLEILWKAIGKGIHNF